MTKVELVNRIMVVTGWGDDVDMAAPPNQIKGTIAYCVDGFAETLLRRVKLQTEVALEKAVTEAIDDLRGR